MYVYTCKCYIACFSKTLIFLLLYACCVHVHYMHVHLPLYKSSVLSMYIVCLSRYLLLCSVCRIYEMELRLDTPLKFRHPCYEALTWFAAVDYLKELKGYHDKGTSPPPYFLEGMKEVVYCFTRWTKSREVDCNSHIQPTTLPNTHHSPPSNYIHHSPPTPPPPTPKKNKE